MLLVLPVVCLLCALPASMAWSSPLKLRDLANVGHFANLAQGQIREAAAAASQATDRLQALNCDGVDLVLDALVGLQLPDVSGSQDEWFGTVHYDITNLTITGVNNGNCAVQLRLPLGVTVSLSHLTMLLHGNWDYNVGIIHGGGTFDVKVSDIHTVVNITMALDNLFSQSKAALDLPQLKVSCMINIGHLDIKMHGNDHKFYDFIVGKLKGSLKSTIEEQLCSIITSSVNDKYNGIAETLHPRV